MKRRDFLRQSAVTFSASACAAALPSLAAGDVRTAQSKKLVPQLRSHTKACIVLWMAGGAPTSLLWDVKPDNRQRIKSIETEVPGIRISEHLPKTAQIMRHLSLVRSMSTRESDVTRAAYYMRTGSIPNSVIQYPAFGSVVSRELGDNRPGLKLPGFVCIGGEPAGPGMLGNGHAAFVIKSNQSLENAELKASNDQFSQRLRFLQELQNAAPQKNRGSLPKSYKQVQAKAANILDSRHIKAVDLSHESHSTIDLYGDNDFGRGLLKARRLVEHAVPFIEVHFPLPWGVHNRDKQPISVRELQGSHMPMLDGGLSGLVKDLERRGMLDDVTIVCMGPFSLSPRNLEAGRSPGPWSAAWTNVIGGGGLSNGQVIGATDDQGIRCTTRQYLPGDVWATVATSLGISPELRYRSPNNRPVRIVGNGDPIKELL